MSGVMGNKADTRQSLCAFARLMKVIGCMTLLPRMKWLMVLISSDGHVLAIDIFEVPVTFLTGR